MSGLTDIIGACPPKHLAFIGIQAICFIYLVSRAFILKPLHILPLRTFGKHALGQHHIIYPGNGFYTPHKVCIEHIFPRELNLAFKRATF